MAVHQNAGDASSAGFADTARQFCEFLETCGPMPEGAFASRAAFLLARLYMEALLLGEVGRERTQMDDAMPALDRSAEVARVVSGLLGTHDCYWEVYDPAEMSEPITTTVSDDLGSVYRDLKEGWMGDGSDYFSRQPWSIAHWRATFTDHWGAHAVDALRALHRMIET